jgi:O-antigen/teichoic acid export membrane protein
MEGESLFLGALLSVEAVGWWSAALRIVSIPIFVPVLITTPLLPALSQIVSDRATFAATLRRAFEMTLIVTVGVSAAIVAFAPVVPSFLGWAPEYQAAIPLMQVLAFVFPPVAMGMVFSAGLVALGDERRMLLALLGTTLAQYAILWVAVPLADAWFGNGAIGAAVARVASEAVMLVAAQILLPRDIMTLGTWLFAGRVLLAGGALILASLPLIEVAWPLAAIAGGLTYVGALLVLRTIRPSDVQEALEWMQGRLRRRRGGAA